MVQLQDKGRKRVFPTLPLCQARPLWRKPGGGLHVAPRASAEVKSVLGFQCPGLTASSDRAPGGVDRAEQDTPSRPSSPFHWEPLRTALGYRHPILGCGTGRRGWNTRCSGSSSPSHGAKSLASFQLLLKIPACQILAREAASETDPSRPPPPPPAPDLFSQPLPFYSVHLRYKFEPPEQQQ